MDGVEFGLDTMNLTGEALVICAQELSDANSPNASEVDDKKVFRVEAMHFGGWGMQILHTPADER